MKKAVLFGAGITGSVMYNTLKNEYGIICAVNNDIEKCGKELAPVEGIKSRF